MSEIMTDKIYINKLESGILTVRDMETYHVISATISSKRKIKKLYNIINGDMSLNDIWELLNDHGVKVYFRSY